MSSGIPTTGVKMHQQCINPIDCYHRRSCTKVKGKEIFDTTHQTIDSFSFLWALHGRGSEKFDTTGIKHVKIGEDGWLKRFTNLNVADSIERNSSIKAVGKDLKRDFRIKNLTREEVNVFCNLGSTITIEYTRHSWSQSAKCHTYWKKIMFPNLSSVR